MKNLKRKMIEENYVFNLNVKGTKKIDEQINYCAIAFKRMVHSGRLITGCDFVYNEVKNFLLELLVKNRLIEELEGKELQKLLLIPMDFVVNIQYVDNIVLNLEKLRLKYLQKQIKDTFLENLFDLIEPTLKKSVYDLFLSGNYAEAVEAGCKEINAELKRIYGIDKVGNLDGDSLITKMLSPNNPILKITKGNSVSDKNIQKGYMMMLQGMWAAIRDPKAHENIIIEKEDAIEKLCFLSMLLRKIKKATKIEVTEEEN